MADIERMTIALTAEMAKTVRAAVDAGDYASSSEIIREALRDWSDKRLIRQRDLDALRASIREGLEDIKAGRMVSAAEARKQLHAYFQSKRRKRAR